jgi:hypothetical protein
MEGQDGAALNPESSGPTETAPFDAPEREDDESSRAAASRTGRDARRTDDEDDDL